MPRKTYRLLTVSPRCQVVDEDTNRNSHIGSDEEIQERLDNFESHIKSQKDKRGSEFSSLQDLEDELAASRKAHVILVNEQGQLKGEEKVSWLVYFDALLLTVCDRRKSDV
jgi:hypothetical protein